MWFYELATLFVVIQGWRLMGVNPSHIRQRYLGGVAHVGGLVVDGQWVSGVRKGACPKRLIARTVIFQQPINANIGLTIWLLPRLQSAAN